MAKTSVLFLTPLEFDFFLPQPINWSSLKGQIQNKLMKKLTIPIKQTMPSATLGAEKFQIARVRAGSTVTLTGENKCPRMER
jgi:hypothetical protein